ncbi:hypothetical protein [Bordetella bronchiseptica]|uniref:hypothetical protein n=1 Tax=Bordetella bronchiseptica TaxID=518 RepID=UPI00081D2FF9|nr:hypothetical protein [Bordetella bronchiseptica]AOB27472.1 hypothetical protein BBB44_15065 [Bordetella bronchiseptica]AZW44786.1 hypothetical protein CWR61_15205 [Bordetella bronchiseptica]
MRAHRHRAAELHAMRLPRRQRNVDRYARAVLAGAMLHHPHLPFQADQLGAASRMTAQRRAGGQLQALGARSGAAGGPRGIRQTIHDSLIRHR